MKIEDIGNSFDNICKSNDNSNEGCENMLKNYYNEHVEALT